MADYAALRTQWGGLSGTTDQKLATVNALMVQTAAAGIAQLTPSQILNAIVFADLGALTQLQLLQLTLLLQGNLIDVSKGTVIRAALQTLFAGKTTTLANLAALVATADQPLTIPWWQSNGFPEPIGRGFLVAAGIIP